MVACAMLAALRATDELNLHVNAALNVSCDPRKVACRVFFLRETCAGMPGVNETPHLIAFTRRLLFKGS